MVDILTGFQRELESSKKAFLARLRDWAAGDQFPGNFSDAFEQALALRQGGAFSSNLSEKIFSDTLRILKARHVERYDRSPRSDEQKLMEGKARHEAREYVREAVMEEMGKWTGEPLRVRAEAELTLLEFVAGEIPEKVRLIEQIVAQVDRVREYEFTQGLMSSKALACTPDVAPLKRIAREMADHREQVQSALKGFCVGSGRPLSAQSDAELKACIKSATALHKTYLPTFEHLAKATDEAVGALDFTVNDKMLEAYIRGESVKIEKIKAAKRAVDAGITLTGAVLNKTNATGFFVRLGRLLSSVAFTSATQASIAIDKDVFLRTDVRTRMFPRYNENPTILAADLQAKQRAALEIFLNALDATVSGALISVPEPVGSTVMEVVDPIVDAVKDAVESILEKRMELAVAEIERIRGPILDSRVPSAETSEDSLWTKVTGLYQDAHDKMSTEMDELEKTIGFRIEEVYTAHKLTESLKNAEHADALGCIIELIAPRVTAMVLQYARISPAETLTGDQLAELLDEIHFSQAPVGTTFIREVKWVSPAPITGESDVPGTVNGRMTLRTNANRSVLTGARRSFCVSLDFDGVEVWGRYDPKNRTWQATEIDQASFKSWNDVQIYSDAIEIGAGTAGTRTAGKWLWVNAPEAGFTYIAFAPTDGSTLRWGHRGDTSGAKGKNYQLQNLIPEKLWVRKSLGEVYKA